MRIETNGPVDGGAGTEGPVNEPADDTITISIPPDPRWVRTIRLATSGMAATGPFDVETIDDLRIAVDELCAALIEAGGSHRVELRLRCVDGTFEVHGETGVTEGSTGHDGAAPHDDERFALSRQILSVVSDDYGLEIGDGRAVCWFRRAAPPELVEAAALTPPAGAEAAGGDAAGGR